MRMLLVLHRATGTSQKAMKEHPAGATTELILIGRVLRARPDRDSRKVSTVPGDEVVVFPGPLDNPGWCSLGETMMWDKAPRARSHPNLLGPSPLFLQQNIPCPRGAKVEQDRDVTWGRGDPTLSRQ